MYLLGAYAKRGKAARAGIDILILLIAMLIVSVVVTSVIWTLSSKMIFASATTMKRSSGDLDGGVTVVILTGADGTSDGLTTFRMKLKVPSQTFDVDLRDSLIELDTNNISADLAYSPTANCTQDLAFTPNGTAGYWTNQTTGKGFFGVLYAKNSTRKHMPDFVVNGDVVILCFQGPRPILEDDIVKFLFVPKYGHGWYFETEMNGFSKENFQIYP